MAKHKFATVRYQTLDKCFRNPGRKYFQEDLLDACNEVLADHFGAGVRISRRQLFDDIQFMESEAGWAVPLRRIREGRRVYYRYEDIQYSINQQPLNALEMEQLQAGLGLLSRIEGVPAFEELQAVLNRLQEKVGLMNLAPVIGFDHNPYLRGIENLGTLFSAIINRQVLRIQYQSFKSAFESDIDFHPYFLKEYNKRWFVFGYHSDLQIPDWNLALDRIRSIMPSRTEFKPCPNTIDWREYFEDFIGVTKSPTQDLVKVNLWVHPATAPYLMTKPLHGSQKVLQEDENGLWMQLLLIPNFEFFQTVLSYGDRIKIVSPEPLADEIRQILQRALDTYLS